jgi:hypothetical protein
MWLFQSIRNAADLIHNLKYLSLILLACTWARENLGWLTYTLEEPLTINPSYSRAWCAAGIAALAEGIFKTARLYADKVLELNPINVSAREMLDFLKKRTP